MEPAVRPLDLDPRGGHRRAGDAGDRDLAGHPGDLPVPAQGLGDHHSGAGGAGFAGRHLRRDVCVRLLHQQHDAAGADAVGRLRGRRRHRDAGKHRAPHRRRHAPVRGGAERLARDRLHHRVDHVLADRGVHPGAADGRHGRPRVPRIRGDDRGRDRGVRLRVADADADAVRARAAQPSSRRREKAELRAARCSSGCSKSWLSAYEWTLDRVLRLQVDHAGGHVRDASSARSGSISSSRRASSRPKIPATHRHHRGRDRHLVPGDGRAPAQGRRDRARRPGGRVCQFDGRRRRSQPDRQ